MFRNVARRLTPDGLFVVHAFVPNLTWWSNGQSVETQALGIDRVWIEASFHKAATQEIDSRYVILGPNSVQVHPVKLRYIWPSEMDMMAKAAGMRLRNRWGGWKKQPFTSGSATHVSVYEPRHDRRPSFRSRSTVADAASATGETSWGTDCAGLDVVVEHDLSQWSTATTADDGRAGQGIPVTSAGNLPRFRDGTSSCPNPCPNTVGELEVADAVVPTTL